MCFLMQKVCSICAFKLHLTFPVDRCDIHNVSRMTNANFSNIARAADGTQDSRSMSSLTIHFSSENVFICMFFYSYATFLFRCIFALEFVKPVFRRQTTISHFPTLQHINIRLSTGVVSMTCSCDCFGFF